MIHAALLLLMREAVYGPRFTISLKRSTQNLQLSTSWAGRLHHLLPAIGGQANINSASSDRLGLLGIPVQPASLIRLVGATFMILGVVLIRT